MTVEQGEVPSVCRFPAQVVKPQQAPDPEPDPPINEDREFAQLRELARSRGPEPKR